LSVCVDAPNCRIPYSGLWFMIVVIDSAVPGAALQHNTFCIVYTPSWLRLRYSFRWDTTEGVLKTLSMMKEYFNTAAYQEKPIRAQRCMYSVRALHVYGLNKMGTARFSPLAREKLSNLQNELTRYLVINPVVAWDWVVSWTECRALAEAYPEEYIRLFRRLRVHYSLKRKAKPELSYFIDIMEKVAREKDIDLEHKWKSS